MSGVSANVARGLPGPQIGAEHAEPEETRMADKPKLQEHDGMVCRACGNEERASEGYPCADCGTFICLICTFRGVTRCKTCDAKVNASKA